MNTAIVSNLKRSRLSSRQITAFQLVMTLPLFFLCAVCWTCRRSPTISRPRSFFKKQSLENTNWSKPLKKIISWRNFWRKSRWFCKKWRGRWLAWQFLLKVGTILEYAPNLKWFLCRFLRNAAHLVLNLTARPMRLKPGKVWSFLCEATYFECSIICNFPFTRIDFVLRVRSGIRDA